MSDCWLPDMSPQDPAHIVGFGLDLSSGSFDFDAAAMHVLSRIAPYFGPTAFVHPSVVFLSHGYGSVLVPRILGYDAQKAPRGWRAIQETLKISTASIVNFASPLLTSRTRIFVDWAAERLKLSKASAPLFREPFGKYRPFQRFTAERGIQLLEFWHRPLSIKPVRFESAEQEYDISTMAAFSSSTDHEFKYLCRVIHKAVGSHRVLKAAAFGDRDTMDTIIRHGDRKSVV